MSRREINPKHSKLSDKEKWESKLFTAGNKTVSSNGLYEPRLHQVNHYFTLLMPWAKCQPIHTLKC